MTKQIFYSSTHLDETEQKFLNICQLVSLSFLEIVSSNLNMCVHMQKYHPFQYYHQAAGIMKIEGRKKKRKCIVCKGNGLKVVKGKGKKSHKYLFAISFLRVS